MAPSAPTDDAGAASEAMAGALSQTDLSHRKQ